MAVTKRKTKLDSVLQHLRDNGWEPGHRANWDDEAVERNYGIIAGRRIAAKNLPLACVVGEILACEQPDTVRGCLYQCVSAGWLPDTSKTSYMKIQRLLGEMRRKRIIPYDWICDNVRESVKPSSWTGLEDFADTVATAYRKDFWAGLPDYVEVIVEKDTVAGRIESVTREFDVALHPLRGYASLSYAHAIGSAWRNIKKPIHVFYIGDHDPSGRDIERNIRESLTEYSGRSDFTWERLAVGPDQFEEFNVTPLAVKHKDVRSADFVAEFGPSCAEVEAVPASALREMVRGAIERHVPAGAWDRLKAIEREEKESWGRVVAKIRGQE